VNHFSTEPKCMSRLSGTRGEWLSVWWSHPMRTLGRSYACRAPSGPAGSRLDRKGGDRCPCKLVMSRSPRPAAPPPPAAHQPAVTSCRYKQRKLKLPTFDKSTPALMLALARIERWGMKVWGGARVVFLALALCGWPCLTFAHGSHTKLRWCFCLERK